MHYDLESTYDERIAPLMSQIIDICKETDMPFIASFAYATGEDGVDYCTSCLIHSKDGPRYQRELDAAAKIIHRGLSPGEEVRITGGPVTAAFTILSKNT